jgi:hypothetical protein
MRHILVAPTNYGGDRRISSIGAIIASSIAPSLSTTSGSQRQRRRFVRDGEMPVAVIRRDHQPDGEHGANQLDAARQAIRSEVTAKERAERLLAEAQAMIRDLQTELGHERLAKNEVLETVRRLETETQVAAHALETAEAELAAERLARHNAEDALAEALEAGMEAERRSRDATAFREAGMPSEPSHGLRVATRTKQTVLVSPTTGATPQTIDTARPTVRAAARKRRIGAGSRDASTANSDSSHLGPVSDGNQESDIVEWWKPGWRKRFR